MGNQTVVVVMVGSAEGIVGSADGIVGHAAVICSYVDRIDGCAVGTTISDTAI